MSSGDKYARRYDKIIEIPRKTKATDDTILWDSDIGEHWWQVINYLDVVGTGKELNHSEHQEIVVLQKD